jgi:glycerol-3-phosphate acyltransferase PlsY
MSIPSAPLLILGAFLCGSIPFGLIIGRMKGIDVRSSGSGNIGATNVGRLLGRPYFFLCLSLDAAKGFLPTLLGGWYLSLLGTWNPPSLDLSIWLATMVAAVCGHLYSPWLGFKGGKGVATSLGALAAVFPQFSLPLVAAFLVWAIVLWRIRFMSAASIAAAATLPVAVLIMGLLKSTAGLGASWALATGVSAALAGLVIWRHRSNIQRLRAGTEPRFGEAGARS